MFLAFLLLVVCFGLYRKMSSERIIYAVVVWNIWSFFLVELLSLLRMLNQKGIICGWGILISILTVVIFVKRRSMVFNLEACKGFVKTKTLKQNCLFILPILLSVIVLGLAIVTVPYNWDSMTYHLSRMAYWAQNESVEHFAVIDVRQLSSPVLAEFVNVQVYILSGGSDKLLNLLQTGSYVVNDYLVYEIAKKLGCKEKLALLGTFLFMTMPIAFGEALTTQVDQFATVWFLIFVYYFIDIYESEKIFFLKEDVLKCIIMGACVSMGYLAKPSVDIGMAILLLILLMKCIRRKDRILDLLKIVVCVVPVVVLPLLPELARNYQTFSAFSDPIAGKRQLIGTLVPNYMFINMVKNFVHNIPNIYLYDSTEWIAKIVMVMAGILRVDINDASISEDGQQYAMNNVPVYGHDTATNPIVVILASVCFLYCLFRFKKNKSAGRNYTIYIMLTFVIFCAFVRWEPFVSRYMLSYLAALCPMIAWQVQEIAEKCKIQFIRTAILPIICFCLLTETFALIRFHQELWHEEVSVRPYAYFYHNKSLKEDYFEVVQWVKENNCQRVGINIGSNQFLWPIWSMLEDQDAQLEYVMVENNSAQYEKQDFIPDCIISDGWQTDEQIEIHGRQYIRVEEFSGNENLWVFVRAD